MLLWRMLHVRLLMACDLISATHFQLLPCVSLKFTPKDAVAELFSHAKQQTNKPKKLSTSAAFNWDLFTSHFACRLTTHETLIFRAKGKQIEIRCLKVPLVFTLFCCDHTLHMSLLNGKFSAQFWFFFFEWKYVLLLVRPYVPTQKLVLTQFNCLFLRFFFFILYFLVILHDHARVRYSAKYFIFSMPVDSFIIRSTLFSLKMCVVFFLSSQSLL